MDRFVLCITDIESKRFMLKRMEGDLLYNCYEHDEIFVKETDALDLKEQNKKFLERLYQNGTEKLKLQRELKKLRQIVKLDKKDIDAILLVLKMTNKGEA